MSDLPDVAKAKDPAKFREAYQRKHQDAITMLDALMPEGIASFLIQVTTAALY